VLVVVVGGLLREREGEGTKEAERVKTEIGTEGNLAYLSHSWSLLSLSNATEFLDSFNSLAL
jgi:hypothetical protein